MTSLDILLFAGGAIILVLSVLAGWIVNRSWVSEVTLCVAAGAGLGRVIDWTQRAQLFGDNRAWTLEQVSWITLGIAVMGVALRLPIDFLSRYRRDVVVILGIGMPLMWLSSAAAAWAILGLGVLPALIVGAIAAPTDPVVSQSIISGRTAERHVPECTRNILLAETGANDGLGQLFIMLPIMLLTVPHGQAITTWLARVLLWEVIAAVAFGAVAGGLAARLFVWAKRRPYVEHQPLLAIALALSLTVLAGVQMIGGDGILAVFAAGLLFNRGISGIQTHQTEFTNALTRFFDLPAFVLIGVLLPWHDWARMGWPLVAFAVVLMFVRRLPWWWLIGRWLPSLGTRHDMRFAGWFGPIGVAAAYYAMVAERETGMSFWPIASMLIAVSVVAHGMTATPLARVLGARLSEEKDG